MSDGMGLVEVRGPIRVVREVGMTLYRQYVGLALSIVILMLAVYSWVRTYQLHRQFTYELLPIIINSITLFILVGLYCRLEVYNTSIILLIV